MIKAIVYYDLDGTRLECKVNDKCISIVDSYKVTNDEDKKYVIEDLLDAFPYFKEYRTVKSMIREWKAHNILFQHNIQPDRTKTTDMELKQNWFFKIGYFLISTLFKEKSV